MSLGFSVEDLTGAANLTYRLIKALHGSQDAGEEYRAAINELGRVQHALIHVSCLGSQKNFPRATFESASCIIMGSMDIIQSYLDRTKKHDQRRGVRRSSGLAQSIQAIGWALFKAEEMKKLRDALHARLASLDVLLTAANLDMHGTRTQYLDDIEHEPTTINTISTNLLPMPKTHEIAHRECPRNKFSHRSASSVSGSIDSDVEWDDGFSGKNVHDPNPANKSDGEEMLTTSTPSRNFSLSCFSLEELRSIILDQASRASKIKELSDLLRTLTLMGDYQLDSHSHKDFVELLDKICSAREPRANSETSKPPITFKDAVGRKFSFPWHLCKSWKGMEDLIKQAFIHVDVLGPHVHEGRYDLTGPNGEIILPQVWEMIVQPAWTVTMHIWPMPEPPPPPSTIDDLLPPPRPKKKKMRRNQPALTGRGIKRLVEGGRPGGFEVKGQPASFLRTVQPTIELSGENASPDDSSGEEECNGLDDARFKNDEVELGQPQQTEILTRIGTSA